MKDTLYMAWRYLRFYRGKTALLIGSISLVLFLPAGLHVLVAQGGRQLSSRAEATPLLIGPQGSAVDLTLSALYFREPSLSTISAEALEGVGRTGLAQGIPLHLRFSVGEHRIVGTTLDYSAFRELEIGQGRWFAMLGECVLGAGVARALNVGLGGHVLSSAGNAFDVAGAFPLKMPVVGILAATDSPDDAAVFVDVKTAWVISGLAHGHDDVLQAEEGDRRVLQRERDNVVASPALLSYTEITPQNVTSFHFHGAPRTFPLDAVLVVPHDRKAGILLRGRYEEQREVQMLVPARVVEGVLETMFAIRNYVVLGGLGVGVATLGIVALVFGLSIRLRRREIETIRKIGGGSGRLRGILSAEILVVIAVGVAAAAALTLAVSHFGEVLVRLINS